MPIESWSVEESLLGFNFPTYKWQQLNWSFPLLEFPRRWWLFNRDKEVIWSLFFILGGLFLLGQQATKYLLISFGVQKRDWTWSWNTGAPVRIASSQPHDIAQEHVSIVSLLLSVE